MKKHALGLAAACLVVCVSMAHAGERKLLVRFGEDIVVEKGTTVKNAVAVFGDVTVDGEVSHTVVCIGGDVKLGPTAVIGHNVVPIAGTVKQEEGALIKGEIVNLKKLCSKKHHKNNFCAGWRGYTIISGIGFLALGLLCAGVLAGLLGRVSAQAEKNVLKSALWGIAGILCILPVAAFLVVSLVGIPLVPLEAIFVACAFIFGYISVAQLIGKRLIAAAKKPSQPMLWEVFWGILILSIAGFVPFFGWLVKMIVSVSGFGAVLQTIAARIKEK